MHKNYVACGWAKQFKSYLPHTCSLGYLSADGYPSL